MEKPDIILSLVNVLRTWVASFSPTPAVAEIIMTVFAIIGCVAIVALSALVLVWMERKVAGFIQARLGPNRLGPAGIFQTLADTLKLLGKEGITPKAADKWVYFLSYIVVFIPALALFAVIPFGRDLVPVDLNIGVLYFVSIGSLTTIALLMAGWGSNNKYSMIGAMRGVAQMISYEVPLIFSLLGAVMIVGSLKLSEIVNFQVDNVWLIVLQPVGFLIYMIAATAETNRAPFDLVEGESELVAGAFTEFSGMRYAMFFMSEYGAMVAVSALATTVFLGGWSGPSFLPPFFWFTLKTYVIIFFFMWIRWTFPRIRVDQLMHFGWKFLLPLSLANILFTGIGLYIYRAIGG